MVFTGVCAVTFINTNSIIQGIIQALPGAIGSMLSLQFVPRSFRQSHGRWWAGIVSFVVGVAVSHYLGGATLEYFKIAAGSIMAQAISFCFGLFGLSLVTNAMAEIRPTFDIIREKFLGK